MPYSQHRPSLAASLRLIFIGTLAPADMGWWHELIEGGGVSTYVQALTADREKWDRWPEIRRCNPLMAKYPESRKKLLQERDEARADARLKARFLSYRMNVPSRDESEMLLTVDDFKLATGRPIGIPSGEPIVGIDLGGRACLVGGCSPVAFWTLRGDCACPWIA